MIGKWLGGITELRQPGNPKSGVMTQQVWNITQYRVDLAGYRTGIHLLASSIVRENVNYWWYCFTALVIAGVYMWAPVYLTLWALGLTQGPSAVFCILISSFALPLSFWTTYRGGWFLYIPFCLWALYLGIGHGY